MAENSKPVSARSVEEKREELKENHPDIYKFVMEMRQVFGHLTVKITSTSN